MRLAASLVRNLRSQSTASATAAAAARRRAVDPSPRGFAVPSNDGNVVVFGRRGNDGRRAYTTHSQLPPEHQMVYEMCRKFADEELSPNAGRWDREHSFPTEAVGKLVSFATSGCKRGRGSGFDRRCSSSSYHWLTCGFLDEFATTISMHELPFLGGAMAVGIFGFFQFPKGGKLALMKEGFLRPKSRP
jgi:hypothetical protein